MSARPGSDKTLSANDGGKRARSPGRARRKPLKPLRAGMPGDPGGPVVATLVCHQHFAHEAAGAPGTRHSPRPPTGREIHATTRAHRAARSRTRVCSWGRHCEERLVRRSSMSEGGSDEAIHTFFAAMDCFAELAMTA